MNIVSTIKPLVSKAIKDLYSVELPESELTINITKPEFEGDYTIVLFSFVKQLKKSPEQLGQELGKALVENNASLFKSYNVIKGFLNLVVVDNYWLHFLQQNFADTSFGSRADNQQRVIVEYSSPNTNKPLHLGHLRNNFLGWSVAEILKRSGYTVFKTAIMNDRGIHICKSMIAWQLFANGATPDSAGIKGDHFVGDYYVLFGAELKKQTAPILEAIFNKDLSLLNDEEKEKVNKAFTLIDELTAKAATATKKEEVKKLQENTDKLKEEIKDIAENKTPLMQATVKMLQDWENGNEEVRALWQKMNGCVYEGFNETYKKIGSDFDKNYFESNTYLLGKTFVEDGLNSGVFFKKDDGSVWIDLTADGLDEKLVLRKDGTSVYITQDLGLADQKYAEYKYDQSIYVIADEQDYHMKVLKLILQKLGKPYANGIHHLSYGLVELPTGRMKTREGTVVDADDIIEELKNVARQKTEELGKVKDFNPGELNELYDTIALGALKFFLLRVDPKKRMIFNPEESIDFHGFTGPSIQFTHARAKAILRKEQPASTLLDQDALLKMEKELIVLLEQYPSIIDQACIEHNPSALAVYIYTVSKTYSSFLSDHSVLTAESESKKQLRLQLTQLVSNTIASAMHLLGIRVPERM
jgi:arginyl-tRNA synthetase